MTSKKPIILCTRASVNSHFLINKAYANAVGNSGGILMMLTSEVTTEDLEKVLDTVDGVLLPGGSDVDPNLYNQERKEYTGDSDNYRDIIESMVIEQAMKRGMPILAICRGLQILNVKLGGTLYQDIEKEFSNTIQHDNHEGKTRDHLAHIVDIHHGCLLERIIGKSVVEVNSLHHQGIHELGKGLSVCAVSPDGLVEAVEMPIYPFMLGVQWHPEELATNEMWKKVFDAFIGSCKK